MFNIWSLHNSSTNPTYKATVKATERLLENKKYSASVKCCLGNGKTRVGKFRGLDFHLKKLSFIQRTFHCPFPHLLNRHCQKASLLSPNISIRCIKSIEE